MRSQALERLGETKRKANEDCERKAKRQQRSGADVTEFPREKSEKELKIREEELTLYAREVENEKKKQAQMFKTQEAMIANMVVHDKIRCKHFKWLFCRNNNNKHRL